MRYKDINKIRAMTPKELVGKKLKVKASLGFYQSILGGDVYDAVWVDYKTVPLLVVMVNNRII